MEPEDSEAVVFVEDAALDGREAGAGRVVAVVVDV